MISGSGLLRLRGISSLTRFELYSTGSNLEYSGGKDVSYAGRSTTCNLLESCCGNVYIYIYINMSYAL